MSVGVRLYVGADAQNVQGRRFNLTGDRCFSAAYGPGSRFTPSEANNVVGLLDSGAFSDPAEKRLDAPSALARQIRWESRASDIWGLPFQAHAIVSYDLLIDEIWTGQQREKRRWSIEAAESAVRTTIEAAAFLATQRQQLAPRRLVLACQGVDHEQYADCVSGVLAHATPTDWIGLGGWCILGWFRSWIPQFWATCYRVLPLIASAGIRHVHIFGVTYRPVLGGLLWLADREGLSVSTDSSGPVLSVTWKDAKKAAAVKPTWEENAAWWIDALSNLRDSDFYRRPPYVRPGRQLTLF